MALKLRRGTELNRVSMTPALAEGELAYVTNHVSEQVSPLWIGDGSTAGGLPVAPVLTVNDKVGQVVLYTDDVTEDETPTNLWFSKDRAQDAAAALFLSASGTDGNLTVGTDNSIHSNISFTYNDSTGRLAASVPIPTTVNSGPARSLAYYATAGTTLSGTDIDALTWDNDNHTLTVDSGTVQVFANNGPRASLILSSHFNSSQSNALNISRSRGSKLSPLTLNNNDSLGTIQFAGYDGTSYVPTARITAFVNNTVSTGRVPSGIGLSNMNANGDIILNLRALETGLVAIGPFQSSDLGTGQLFVTSTVNPGTLQYNNSVVNITTIFDGVDGQNITIARQRGTKALPTTVVSGDDIVDLSFLGYDGTNNSPVALITVATEGTITTGKVPGNISIRTSNTNGTLVEALKISAPSTSTSIAKVNVSATLSTSSTPGTFWNYDVSSSTLDLTTGNTVTFANFSGSVLVNCFNSGTVTQYLCGGGGAPIATGSSKVTVTGAMSASPGSNGYTFTASETGLHSFYVIRTRSGA